MLSPRLNPIYFLDRSAVLPFAVHVTGHKVASTSSKYSPVEVPILTLLLRLRVVVVEKVIAPYTLLFTLASAMRSTLCSSWAQMLTVRTTLG